MKQRLAAIIFFLWCLTAFGQQKTDPVDYVYPYIGTINPKTRPTVPVIKVPGGNIGLFPSFTPEVEDLYLADRIYGFPLGFGTLMINTGIVKTDLQSNASGFDHDLETAKPYYYQVLLENSNINTEFTVTANTVIFRFTIPASANANLFLTMAETATIAVNNENTIQGVSVYHGHRNAEVKNYFFAEFSKPFHTEVLWEKDSVRHNIKEISGYHSGICLGYPSNTKTVELKIGVSSTSIDEARTFIRHEIGLQTFNQIKEKARDLWNRELGIIEIKGGTEKQKSIFYTALYRTRSLRMGNVWDTYRCAYPLQTILKPEETTKAIRDFINAYEQTGWLPSSGAMIGNHSTAVIVDAYRKELRDYDVEKAYAGMRKNAMEATMIPWKDEGHITELEQCYFDKGFFPALPVRPDFDPTTYTDFNPLAKMPYQISWMPETGVKEWIPEVDSWHRRQSVSVTLEHCYDDWCLAMIAKDLGKEEDYKLFIKRAHNYKNLFNPAIGMMAPKSADGKWIEPFDPRFSGGFAGEGYFAESNSWTYTWHVQHDPQGLINLMGGRDQFNKKLDSLFIIGRTMDKLHFLGQFPDMTGLVGMYTQGNEPAFHIPYLYDYSGQPWKTQRRVRQLMDLWYDITPLGLSGDEDGGAMSSWYVFSAMGFYPLCPGRPEFEIGSPLFEETKIHIGKGKTFLIRAVHVSGKNKYIQSAMLNGKPLYKPWFRNADLMGGGSLVLNMGSRPNKSWGSSASAAPPSMTVAE